jgi:hypothetical protein
VAANCSPYPKPKEMEAGVTAIEDKAGPVTVMVVEAEMELAVAEMVAVPWPELVASPLLPATLLRMATVANDEFQLATVVRSCVLPSV